MFGTRRLVLLEAIISAKRKQARTVIIMFLPNERGRLEFDLY